MRKIALFFLLFLALPGFCHAAPCYGTKLPEARKFFTGAQTYILHKRQLKDELGKLKSTQYFLLLSYGVFDWLSVDLRGGAGNIHQHPQQGDTVEYSSGFAGGYGFRVKFYDDAKSRLVFGFQHISVHPQDTDVGDAKNKAVMNDWQFSLLASRQFFKFTPYVGTRWSYMDYNHRVDNDRKREKSDRTKDIGLILGTDFAITERVWLNLEAQFLDAQAYVAGLNFSF